MKSKQVLDVQQMQHLQELGLELKETMLYWVVYEAGHENNFVTTKENAMEVIDESCGMLPAYTLQDVLDALPKFYHIANIGWTKLSIRVHTTKEWEIGYVYTDELSKYAYGCRILGKELIDAAYELLVWCIENKVVETNKNE
jgi:hypothetical protein